jgi:imidazolonepropionase-like amidohydrolase
MSMIVIRNGRIIDGCGGVPWLGSLVIEDDSFTKISAADVSVPPDATVIDATGKTILPGLIDMHSHLLSGGFDSISEVIDSFDPATQRRSLKQMLYWGVTSTYSPVQPLGWGLELRSEVANQVFDAPRLFISGPGFTAPSGWAGSLLPLARMEPSSTGEAERQVNELADAGVDILKIYYDTQCCAFVSPLPKMELAIMQQIIRTAHSRNVKVMLHAYDNDFHVEALKAGVDILAHSAVTAPVDDEYVELATEANALYLATLSVYHDAFDEASLRSFIKEDFVQQTVPRKTLNTLAKGGPLDEFLKITKKDYIRGQLSTIDANLKKVADSGIAFGVGPDTGVMGAFPGISVHREMELMVNAGVAPLRVLEAASRTAAASLGAGSLGTIQEGKVADLVVVNGKPDEEITDTRKIELVMKAGRIINREKLLHEILESD